MLEFHSNSGSSQPTLSAQIVPIVVYSVPPDEDQVVL
jgi:hypothetical protein